MLLRALGQGSHNVASLLIQPVQRIPRYKLLLEELHKATPPAHADAAAIGTALEAVSGIAASVNEAVRRREAVEKVVELQGELWHVPAGVAIDHPGRFLIRQGVLVCHGLEAKPKTCEARLFNDGLLLAERTLTGKLSFLKLFTPEGASADDAAACALHLRMPAALGKEQALLQAVAASGAERDSWLEDLSRIGTVHDLALGRAASSSMLAAGSSKEKRPSLGGAQPMSSARSGVLAGWLKKKGGGGADGNTRNWAKGGRLNWKKRWVVVTTTQFVSWYANEKCDELKGSMALHGAQVVASKKAGGFWILTNTRSLELVADSAPIAESWVRVLQDTANQVPQQVQVQPGPEVRRTPSSRAVDSERESGSWDIDANGESDLEDDSAPIRPGQADQPARVRAMYDYVAAEDDELTMKAGDIIDVIDSEGDWWMGRIGGIVGNFPSNYAAPYEER